MDCIKIVNWEKFQHYKDRRPTWVKLYIEVIQEFDEDGIPKKFYSLPDSAKLTFYSLLSLRPHYNKHIPYKNKKWLKERLGINNVNLQPLVNAGFITIDSNSVPNPYQNDTEVLAPETYKEEIYKEENREERAEKIKHLDSVFLTEEEYQKLIARYGKWPTEDLIEDLDHGIDSKGYKYKNHYKTLLNWAKRDNIPIVKKPEPREKPPPKKPIKLATKAEKEDLRKKAGGIFKKPDFVPRGGKLQDEKRIQINRLMREDAKRGKE